MRDIPGFEGLYAVTDDGQVWSHPKTRVVGNNRGVREDAGRWLAPSKARYDRAHLRVYLGNNGVRTPMLVHRAVALAYIPNPQNLPHINHLDGDPTNNRVGNLEWCTAKSNARHAVRTGLTKMPTQKGASNSRAKLTEAQVLEMRQHHKAGESAAAIGRLYGVLPKTAWDICNGRSWQHLITPE